MSTYSVDEDFIREAHKAACTTWRTRIEEKFPQLFKISLEEITSLPEYEKYRPEAIHMSQSIRINTNGYIQIELPISNTNWTFSAWNLAKAICDKWPKYFPTHKASNPHNFIVLEHN